MGEVNHNNTMMQEELTIDDIETDLLTPDEVAARCTEYEFAGQKLNPFTRTRQTAAATMRVKVFSGVETDDNGMYPEMLTDAIKIIWLCAADNKAARRGCIKPDEAIERALDWWEEFGGDIGGKLHKSLIETFASILTDIQSVSAETDSSGSSSNADSLGE
jgi:hypothetical protein